jgi:hypothetical protein
VPVEICTVDFGEIAEKRIQRYVGFCDSALGQLRLDKRDLLSGIQKQAMTEWWLELIESRVDEFLKSVGYHFAAVPDDYIGTPPSNIDHVEENLHLVSNILDPSDDVYQVKAFIEELKVGSGLTYTCAPLFLHAMCPFFSPLCIRASFFVFLSLSLSLSLKLTHLHTHTHTHTHTHAHSCCLLIQLLLPLSVIESHLPAYRRVFGQRKSCTLGAVQDQR